MPEILFTDAEHLPVIIRRTFRFFVSGANNLVNGQRFILAGIALASLLKMSCAHGAHITMATQYAVTPTAAGPVLAVTVKNRGDVPAHAVQMEVSVEGRAQTGPVQQILGVDESFAAEFPLAAYLQKPGRYPLVIRTYYKDSAGHRFTALIVGFYDFQSEAIPDVSIQGQATVLPVEGQGRVVFMLRNDGAATRSIDLELLLSDELSAAREHATVEVAAEEAKQIVFDVENFSALENSSYPITLVGRYENAGQGVGVAVAGSATVRVVGGKPATMKPLWIWFLLGGLLPGVVACLGWYERKMRLQSK